MGDFLLRPKRKYVGDLELQNYTNYGGTCNNKAKEAHHMTT